MEARASGLAACDDDTSVGRRLYFRRAAPSESVFSQKLFPRAALEITLRFALDTNQS